MLLGIIIAIALGIICGVLSGLTPGIHLNLVSALVVACSPLLLLYTSTTALGCFIIAMAITHTILDTLPGIYLGAPESAEALNVLPGHRFLLKGEGHSAVVFTVMGSFFSLLLGILLFPILVKSIWFLSPFFEESIGLILLGMVLFLLVLEKAQRRLWSAVLFLCSGVLGYVVLNKLQMEQPLLPLLSGLFGISLLLMSLYENTNVPPQLEKIAEVDSSTVMKATIGATTAGFFAAFLPGFGSSQAAVLATLVFKNLKEEGFLCLVGGINTANMLLSLATLFVIDKARNGAIVAIKELIPTVSFQTILFFLASALIAGSLATLLCLFFSKIFCRLLVQVDYFLLVKAMMGLIVLMCVVFDGLLGVLVLITATSLGIIASVKKTAKSHLMGCLLVPVMIYFLL